MSSQVSPSHVAVLVPSVRKAAEYLKSYDFKIGEEEVWEGEGTKEIYIELGKANSLLLMEPIKAGAYQRALEKRGPGLHHLAIDVLDVENFVDSLSGSGWFLHPRSLKTIQHSKTAYLARPGFPALIEVQEKKKIENRSLFVEGISMPMEKTNSHLIQSIGLERIISFKSNEMEFFLGGKTLLVKNLY